jgi:hypothetical protein
LAWRKELPASACGASASPETALPWVALIGAYTGMRLEEIAQRTVKAVPQDGAA